MKIAVLGTGRVGGTLGRRWAQQGHSVHFGSRNPQSDTVQNLLRAAGENAAAGSYAEAVKNCDVIIYAAPWPAAESILAGLGELAGKVLVDCTNPLTSDFTGLDVGHTTSAAEKIAAMVPQARVVKAFNNVSSAVMANPKFGELNATMFLCGDDKSAKDIIKQLANELDFDAVDAGPLKIARFIEPFAMLYIQLAVREGWGSNCAFKIMKR